MLWQSSADGDVFLLSPGRLWCGSDQRYADPAAARVRMDSVCPLIPETVPGGPPALRRAVEQRPVMLVRRVCQLPKTGQRYRPEICTRAAITGPTSHRAGPDLFSENENCQVAAL